MTQLLSFGWEADRLYKNNVTVAIQCPSRPVTITGYQIKLAMIPSDAPFIGNYKSAQVLWFINVDGIPFFSDFGAPVYKDSGGTAQNLHGGGITNVCLVTDILKASPWTDAVNDALSMSGLRISVPANGTLRQFAAHAGQGPVDFECQGVIFYE